MPSSEIVREGHSDVQVKLFFECLPDAYAGGGCYLGCNARLVPSNMKSLLERIDDVAAYGRASARLMLTAFWHHECGLGGCRCKFGKRHFSWSGC